MLKRNLLTIAAISLLLCGCQPKGYISKKESLNGSVGYEEIALDSTTYQVVYEGGGEMPDLLDRYALFRSAELTIEKGYDYFVVLESNPTSLSGVRSMPTGPGGSMQTRSYALFSAMKTIRLGKGKPPDNASGYDARSMIATMGPTIERPTKYDR